MASEDGSGEEDKKLADMQVDNPEIQAEKEAEPNPNHEDSVMEDKEEEEKENDTEKAKESVANEDQETEKAEEEKEDEEEKGSKKGSGVKTPVSRNRVSKMREATIERPSRERKTVERYTETSVARGSKPFSVGKGKRTMLKDIPNGIYRGLKVKQEYTSKFSYRGTQEWFWNSVLQR